MHAGNNNHKNSFGILMYHRVAAPVADLPPPTWNVAPRRLRSQLAGLISRGYRPWPLRKVLQCRATGEPLPPKTFVVTFDDGYDNLYYNAWPILRELAVPATIFVATAYLDRQSPFAFDDWPAAGTAGAEAVWLPLTSDHCREMSADGLIEIGSHTHTHADLRGRPEIFHRDLARSMELLRGQLGLAEVPFAFPFGYCGEELIEAARRCGAACALTAVPEPIAPRSDPFGWGRFVVGDRDSAATLALKLDGWYSLVRRWWRKLRGKSDQPRRGVP
jgi:peptidoglycan/xylan/chitin deacetylase (PgdA/CDA1 family)